MSFIGIGALARQEKNGMVKLWMPASSGKKPNAATATRLEEIKKRRGVFFPRPSS
jgi:hypothetical protein